ncbi:MAG: sorbosone dehydrogenase family protein [Flavobacteriales bacterium]|nr:sorbosone dehydrogenase family protein [Flavobacteriales bacterium]
MRARQLTHSFLTTLVLWGFSGAVCAPSVLGGDPDLDDIRLPEGFRITVFAENVKDARAMCWGDRGTLFVGSRNAGVVHALLDTDGDFVADEQYPVATDLNMPAGVAFKNGDLYVSAVDRIVRFPGIEDRLADPPAPEIVYVGFPREAHHGWKFIAFGPDDKLYVPVGAPCNVCEPEDPLFASITRLDPDGGGPEIVAQGVRNTVGFDWDPRTGDMWFTDNGRDWLGDDAPPCELNHLTSPGQHFGFPYYHGRSIRDPEFGDPRVPFEFVPPARELGPHVAPLGMRFYEGEQFPEEYRNAIFIAEHGSWNRTSPSGYRVMVVREQDEGGLSYEPFAEGWLQGTRASGRPVDVLEMPDGSLLVSDDSADRIYRISYEGER